VVTDMPNLSSYLAGSHAAIKATANIRTAPALDAKNIVRVSTGESAVLTGTVVGAVDPQGGSNVWYTWWDGKQWLYTAKSNVTAVTAPASTGFTQAQVDAAVAAKAAADASALTAAVNAATAPLNQKIAKARADLA
jgi:hypothetical protein